MFFIDLEDIGDTAWSEIYFMQILPLWADQGDHRTSLGP